MCLDKIKALHFANLEPSARDSPRAREQVHATLHNVIRVGAARYSLRAWLILFRHFTFHVTFTLDDSRFTSALKIFFPPKGSLMMPKINLLLLLLHLSAQLRLHWPSKGFFLSNARPSFDELLTFTASPFSFPLETTLGSLNSPFFRWTGAGETWN